jgi:hypothetical protein
MLKFLFIYPTRLLLYRHIQECAQQISKLLPIILHNILPDDYLFHVKVLVKLTKYSTLLI